MREVPSDDSVREQRLEQVLAEYLRAEERGEAADQAVLIDRHPELAEELASFFRNRSAMEQMARRVGPYELPTTDGSGREEYPAAGEMVKYVGDYELLEEIARGGMGVVYRARQISLNRIVAVKMILAGTLATKQDVERFRAEAESAAKLDHAGIVPIYEVGEHEGKHYFSMAYVDGGSLATSMPAVAANPQEAIPLLVRVCRAVHFAHQRGILHRDLKPANILLDAAGMPHVTDFGLAKQVDRDSGVTQSGTVLGTPSYMAPEQARAEKMISTAADVYALGAILYEMLTGRPPFRGATAVETLRQVLDEEAARPRTVNRLVDRDLETIALKCLEKEAGRRYESAAAMADDLERWQRSEPIIARRAGRIERLQKWVNRRPALAAMAVLAFVLCGMLVFTGTLGAAGILWQWRNVVAEQQRTKQALYASRVALAGSELARDNIGAAEFMLDQCEEELRGWEWSFLRRAVQGNLVTLPNCDGHSNAEFAISPDGKRIVAAANVAGGTRSTDVVLYDVESGAVVWRTRANHSADGGHLGDMVFSPDGKELFGVVTESYWRKATTLGVVPNKFWTEFAHCIRVWDAASGRELRTLSQSEPKTTSLWWGLSISPDGKLLARAVENTTILQDSVSGEEKHRLQGTFSRFAPLGKRFAGPKGHLLVGEIESSGPFDNWLGPETSLFSRDGRWRAGVEAGAIAVFRGDTGETVWKSPRYSKSARAAFSQDDNRLAGVGAEGRVTIWESATGKNLESFNAPVRHLLRLFFNVDGELRGVLSVGDKLKIWTALPDRPDRHVLKNPSAMGIALSPDGDHLALLTRGEGAVVWHLPSQKIVARLGGEWPSNRIGNAAKSIAFSPDGKLIAYPARDDKVEVWNWAEDRRSVALEDHPAPVKSVAFSSDGELLATAGEDGVVRTWTVGDGRLLASAKIDRQVIDGVDFHSSGQWVAANTWGAGVQSFDASTGAYLGTQQLMGTHAVAFSPDGKFLAHAQQRIEIWHVPDSGRFTMSFGPWGKYRDHHQEVALMMKGHLDSITACAYSDDGKRLYTGDESGTIKVWDTASGQETFAIPGDGNGVTSMSVSGQRLAVAFQDGTVRIFDGTPLSGR